MKPVCKYEVVFIVVERAAEKAALVTVLTEDSSGGHVSNSNNRSGGSSRCSSLCYRTTAGKIGRDLPVSPSYCID